jgi:hypothetical protein
MGMYGFLHNVIIYIYIYVFDKFTVSQNIILFWHG